MHHHLMNVLLLVFLIMFHFGIPVVIATDKEGESEATRVQADPDTTCSNAYRKNATKEACLSTKDYFQRPCCFCEDKKGNDYCYNMDEARWASWFGDKCEYRPDADNDVMYLY